MWKVGRIKNGNCCNFGRHYGRKLHCLHYDIVHAAPADGRQNEPKKMVTS